MNRGCVCKRKEGGGITFCYIFNIIKRFFVMEVRVILLRKVYLFCFYFYFVFRFCIIKCVDG